jgi:hypothetical protein
LITNTPTAHHILTTLTTTATFTIIGTSNFQNPTNNNDSPDMKRQVILDRLAMKIKADKEKLLEQERLIELNQAEIKRKNEEKSKVFQEITNERVMKRLKVSSD